jgi:hypothetical protein
VPRIRTAKRLAQRIDPQYFTRSHPLRRWLFLLSVLSVTAAALYAVWLWLAHDSRPYSSGPMSAAHAILTPRCSDCHVEQGGFFSAQVSDRACLVCHDGPIHHANQPFTPNCSSCHEEHKGRIRLAATPDTSCTRCHASLKIVGATTQFASNITSFTANHPQFAAVRPGYPDPGTIKLNHVVHLKPKLKGPNGPVQLECADCHRTLAASHGWRFSLEQPAPVSVAPRFSPPSQVATRAYMAPISYARHCGGCHPLQFDKRFTESVPHDTPEVVHAFLMKKFQDYLAAHPAELRVTASNRNLPRKPMLAAVWTLSPQQWASERVAESEQLLWRKTCKECHSLSFSDGSLLPAVTRSSVTARWFQHAVFDHEQHRMSTCTSCHPRALTSQETVDVLLPGIATCRQCHLPGADAAESRCFECHTYHDWSKEKEVGGKFTLSDLPRGHRATSGMQVLSRSTHH